LIPKRHLNVAVAIIQDAQQRILLTQRSSKTTYAGYWEFPGGKLLETETPETALIREIKEEVDLNIQNSCFLDKIHHQYETCSVCLFVYHVTDYTGVASSQEGQMDLRWVLPTALNQYQFPEANDQVIALMQQKHLI
jgi:8-oxo-dGTP diphosphatase